MLNKLWIFFYTLAIAIFWINIEFLIVFFNALLNEEELKTNNSEVYLKIVYCFVLFLFAVIMNSIYWFQKKVFILKFWKIIYFTVSSILILIRFCIFLAILLTWSKYFIDYKFFIFSNIFGNLIFISIFLYYTYNRHMFANEYASGTFARDESIYYEMCAFGHLSNSCEEIKKLQMNKFSQLKIANLEDLVDWVNVHSYKL